jgi:FtsP/CotA-like multicopper oxidase with cupredoxin domain
MSDVLWTPDGDREVRSDAGTGGPAPGRSGVSRRAFLRIGAGGAAAAGLYAAGATLGPSLASRGFLSPNGVFGAASVAFADGVIKEVFPTSPLVLHPFTDPLVVPRALRPDPGFRNWSQPPGPGAGQQNSIGNERHQKWVTDIGAPLPLVYPIDLLVGAHSFTTSTVLPLTALGQPAVSFDESGRRFAAGIERNLPDSTIYGFNGQFPGPMINAEYGKPALLRFKNRLNENPRGLDRQDFGSPDLSFLTHLHNAHTAPESDGNPHYSMRYGPHHQGYELGQWVDNLYLNWPAGSDDREKQSFFWFHDHRMDHTGSNVYKGLVGLYPIYDPKNGMDMGDERQGLRLPGVRTNHSDGSFDVAYDIPLVLYDCRLDDGVTLHSDIHDSEFPAAGNPRNHPEWWGKTFFRHFPNKGFVGDLCTVNGTAFPTLKVKRRKYRFRLLDASVSRVYELQLMSSTQGPKAAKDLGYINDELQGQYRIQDGQQSMRLLQIASDGGLLPFAINRDSIELWPAKRREVVIDFRKYQDGSPTSPGDVIYLTNVMKMPDGRMWTNSTRSIPDPNYKIPLMSFVIDSGKPPVDNSVVSAGKALRPLPPLPGNWQSLLANRSVFEVNHGGLGGEIEWLINGAQFDPNTIATSLPNPAGKTPLASQPKGSFNLWEVRNGGGGWVHPFHLHFEEHRTVMRNGRDVSQTPDAGHPDDKSREDLIALDPGESVIVYRGFRDFSGPYVAHCHNLIHEDHSMMFAWEVA